jgi:enoyl-CoA hydratase/carnithine racemase
MLSLVRYQRRAYSSAHHHNKEAPVVIENKGETTKIVTLNRPKVLNALDLPMVRMMTPLFRVF